MDLVALPADVSRADQVRAAMDAVAARWGRVDEDLKTFWR